MLFAFCCQWVWDETTAFLLSEQYDPRPLSGNQNIQSVLRDIIRKNKWPINTAHSLRLSYLLGKAKILTQGCILWRPTAAIVEPPLQRFFLRAAARAFSLLLRLLTKEIRASFLVLKISDLHP